MVAKTTVNQPDSPPFPVACRGGSPNQLVYGVLAVFFLLASLIAIHELTKIPRTSMDTVRASQSTQTIREFYAALNEYMETGDASAVSQNVAPDALAFVPAQGAMGADSGLLTYLLALRSTLPQLRFTIDHIDAGGDIAIASVRILGRADATAAEPSASEISQEFFLVRDGRIVQHWTTAPSLALLHPLTESPMRIEVTQTSHLAIAELTFPLGQDEPQPIDGPALVVVQTGRLTLTGNGSSQILDLATGDTSVPEPNTSASAGAGQAIFIPEYDTFVWNKDSDVAHAHIATLAYDPRKNWAHMPGDKQPLPPAPNDLLVMNSDRVTVHDAMTVRPLALDDRSIPVGTWELEIAWAVLGPGASLPVATDGEWAVAHIMSGFASNRRTTLTNTSAEPILAFLIRLRASP